MRYLKLYEGYYEDSIKKIEQLKQEMDKVKEDYISEVKNCIWDLIDDFGAVECEVDEDEGEGKSDDIVADFEIDISIENGLDKFHRFLDVIIEVNDICKSHIGKEISFSWIGAIRTYPYFLTNLYNDIDKIKDFADKVKYIKDNIDKHLLGGMDSNTSYSFIISI